VIIQVASVDHVECLAWYERHVILQEQPLLLTEDVASCVEELKRLMPMADPLQTLRWVPQHWLRICPDVCTCMIVLLMGPLAMIAGSIPTS
jgi:hypothetical protein